MELTRCWSNGRFSCVSAAFSVAGVIKYTIINRQVEAGPHTDARIQYNMSSGLMTLDGGAAGHTYSLRTVLTITPYSNRNEPAATFSASWAFADWTSGSPDGDGVVFFGPQMSLTLPQGGAVDTAPLETLYRVDAGQTRSVGVTTTDCVICQELTKATLIVQAVQ